MISDFEGRANLTKLNTGIGRIFDRFKQIRPSFSHSWLEPEPPPKGESVKVKEFNYPNHSITFYQMKDGSESLLFLKAHEYELGEEQLRLLELMKNELMEHYPKSQQLTSVAQARNYVNRFCNKNVYNLAKKYEISLGKNRTEEVENVRFLSEVLARYTAGLGVLEPILKENFIQDVYIDSPIGEHPLYVTISKLDERLTPTCVTNITLGPEDSEGLLSRFRYISGRPFSEAMPLLECDLPDFSSRVTVIGPPLSPEGVAFAIRRHSTEPWTLPLLIDAGSISPLCAGLLSFFVAGKSTVIVAGSRGAGKTSLLGAIMLEFPKTQRVLTIEDTLELPGEKMRHLGYKLQSIQVSSSVGTLNEMTADDALRIALRLGESAIVMGEVRGEETKTLYEAMSAGTAGSSVLGTFHANSAEAVYKRVVSDMGISPQSFSATDVVVVAGLVQPKGVQRKTRRVVQVAELLKDAKDPGRFQDLLKYDYDVDALVETREFSYHSERISAIAHSWDMTVEEALENIKARARIKEIIVKTAREEKRPYLLGAQWVVWANAKFDELMDRYSKGKLDHRIVVREWKKWFARKKGHG
jgi:type IV secretory pathway ATPase VirB11/archaellum biosynthesis ATPase